LEKLKYINLEDGEKENQILSQKENSKRSSMQAATQKLPFTERIFWGKSKKKITWILNEETQVPETNEMEDSLGLKPQSEKGKFLKKGSNVFTAPTVTEERAPFEQIRSKKIMFPPNYC
jgi:hypothetical protein